MARLLVQLKLRLIRNALRASTGARIAFVLSTTLAALIAGGVFYVLSLLRGYGIAAEIAPAGSMIAHSENAFVIDQQGRLRLEMGFDPGPGTTATISSFAAELTDAAQQLLRPS